MKELIKKLAKSKTIQGIVIVGVSITLDKLQMLIPAETIAEYKPLVTAILSSTELGGLALAWYGRMKAAGPLVLKGNPSPGPSPLRVEGQLDKDNSIGTGTER